MSNQAQNPMGKDWLTTTQAARLTGWSATYVRKLAMRGMIVGFKGGRDWWVLQDSLLAFKRDMDALGPEKHNPWRAGQADGRGRRRG